MQALQTLLKAFCCLSSIELQYFHCSCGKMTSEMAWFAVTAQRVDDWLTDWHIPTTHANFVCNGVITNVFLKKHLICTYVSSWSSDWFVDIMLLHLCTFVADMFFKLTRYSVSMRLRMSVDLIGRTAALAWYFWFTRSRRFYEDSIRSNQ